MTTIVTSVDSATTSATLVSANAARTALVISNTDTNRLYILQGPGTAGTTSGLFTDYLDEGDTSYIDGSEAQQAWQGVWLANGTGGASITQTVTDAQVATTITSVNSTTSSTLLIAGDGSRLSLILENSDANRLYIKIGGAASLTDYSFSLAGGSSATISAPEVFESFYGIWSGDGSGACQITATASNTSIGGADANLGDMKNRIASDLERTLTDTTWSARTWDDEIEDCIFDAIKLNRSKPFWFLQEPQTVSLTSATSAGFAYVAEYPGLLRLDSLRITIAGQLQRLYQISHDEMESRFDGNTSGGEPFEFERWGGRVRLYPTPNAAYTLTWSGVFQDSTLTGNEVSNGWMTHGELLIRSTAKVMLLRDYIKSYEDVPAAMAAQAEAERALYREHVQRMSKTRMAKRV